MPFQLGCKVTLAAAGTASGEAPAEAVPAEGGAGEGPKTAGDPSQKKKRKGGTQRRRQGPKVGEKGGTGGGVDVRVRKGRRGKVAGGRGALPERMLCVCSIHPLEVFGGMFDPSSRSRTTGLGSAAFLPYFLPFWAYGFLLKVMRLKSDTEDFFRCS